MPNIKDNMHTWDNDQIRDYYDQNPNLTILTYAGMLGLTGGELKDILMTDGNAVDKEEEATAEAMSKQMDNMKAIDIIEGHYDDLEEHEYISAWQHLIDNGPVWQFQGSFGRMAARLIADGVCTK